MKVLFIIDDFVLAPLGVMYLGAVVQKKGHEVQLVKINEDVLEKCKTFKPDLVAYSVMTGSEKEFLNINRRIKAKYPALLSIFGGPHPTFFPEIINEDGVDIICVGEGEKPFAELLEDLEGKKSILKIENLWIKKDGVICKNPVRPLIEDLDDIDFPNREIIYKYEGYRNSPIKHFIASRGCPYNCSYCFNHSYFELYKNKGKRVRLRSVENVMNEIKKVVDGYPAKVVYFQDDTFILNKQWLREFSERYRKEVGLPLHCHIRANLVDEEVCQLLKDANCTGVHIAAETADDMLRNDVLKRNMTKEQIYNASGLLRRYGIKFLMHNIIGLPKGSLEKDIETLKMNIECKPTYGWVAIFQPYPRTELSKIAIENGYCTEADLCRLDRGFFDRSVMKIKNSREIANLQKLFGIAVKYPWFYKTGLLSLLIRIPRNSIVKRLYGAIYRSFRKRCDVELYGTQL